MMGRAMELAYRNTGWPVREMRAPGIEGIIAVRRQPPQRMDEPSRSPDPGRAPATNERRSAARPFFKRILGSLTRPPAARPPASVRDARRAISMCHALLSERGEVSGARLATDVLTAYQALGPPALDVFFDLL